MPELPEVETVTRRIGPRVVNRMFDSVEVLDSLWCKPETAGSFEALLQTTSVSSAHRRGKYLIWDLSSGLSLVMHLRMTGTLLYDADHDAAHTRVIFELSDGHRVSFCDPRRFGTGLVIPTSDLDQYFSSRLGLEPFDPGFDCEHLFALTRGRRTALKSFLLDQRLIAGIGNIYADEAMFRAGLAPLRRPMGLTRAETERLREAIVDSLTAGIDAGGATIDDFRDPDGAWGAYQSQFLVHRREGRDCPDCGTAIKRITVGGRSTYFCPSCQRRGGRSD